MGIAARLTLHALLARWMRGNSCADASTAAPVNASTLDADNGLSPRPRLRFLRDHRARHVGQHCCRRAFKLRVLQQRRLPAASKAEATAAPAAEASCAAAVAATYGRRVRRPRARGGAGGAARVSSRDGGQANLRRTAGLLRNPLAHWPGVGQGFEERAAPDNQKADIVARTTRTNIGSAMPGA